MTLSLIFLTAYLLKNPQSAALSVAAGLKLFARKLLPALFPLSVVSQIFCRMGRLPILPTRWLARLFGIDESCMTALIFGLFAGFPVGASAIGTLYLRGKIGREDAERMLGIVSCPGAAFLIGGVGASMFSDVRIGQILYLGQLLIVFGLLLLHKWTRRAAISADAASATDAGRGGTGEAEARLSVTVVTESVGAAVSGMLAVCGYVVIFSVVIDFVCTLAAGFGESILLDCIIRGILEIGSGMQSAAAIGGMRGLLLGAMFAGWSGFCVCLQVASVCGGASMARYLRDRLLIALLLPIVTWILSTVLGIFP